MENKPGIARGERVTIKGQHEGTPWGEGIILYPDYGGGYTNLYMR